MSHQREAAKPVYRRLYEGWMAVAAHFGEVQTLLVLTLAYVFALGPVWLGLAAARRDLLHKRELRSGGTAWSPADTAEPDLERARRLF